MLKYNSDCRVIKKVINTYVLRVRKLWGNFELRDRWTIPLKQGWGTLILEGGVPAVFSSNPNQTHLNQLIEVFRMQLGVFFQGFLGLELNSAREWPSRINVPHPCFKGSTSNVLVPDTTVVVRYSTRPDASRKTLGLRVPWMTWKTGDNIRRELQCQLISVLEFDACVMNKVVWFTDQGSNMIAALAPYHRLDCQAYVKQTGIINQLTKTVRQMSDTRFSNMFLTLDSIKEVYTELPEKLDNRQMSWSSC